MASENLAGIASLISAVAALGATAVSALALRASRKNGRKIEEVHVSINSRMDQLLQARGDASMAQGVEQGRAEARSPADEPPIKVEIVKVPPGAGA